MIKHHRFVYLIAGGIVTCGTLVYFLVCRPRIALEGRNACRVNLLDLYTNARLGANVYEDLPMSLQGVAGVTERPTMFVCPASGHRAGDPSHVEEWAEYGYVGGLPEAPGVRCVVAFCPPLHHGGAGANVLFNDSSIVWYEVDDFVRLTNTPSLFWGTHNSKIIGDLSRKTKIFYPTR
jgi:hypothetical protein